MTLESLTDAVLWDRAQGGDEHAFAVLFDRHSRTVYNYCFRRTADWSAAEDLTEPERRCFSPWVTWLTTVRQQARGIT